MNRHTLSSVEHRTFVRKQRAEERRKREEQEELAISQIKMWETHLQKRQL